MLCRHVCFVSNNLVADECDRVVLDKTALCMDTLCIQQCDKCDESTSRLCVRQIDVEKEIKFRSRYMMFGYHCNINNPEYHVRRRFDCDPSRIPVKKLRKLSSDVDIRHLYVYFSPVYCFIDLKSEVIKVLFMKVVWLAR